MYLFFKCIWVMGALPPALYDAFLLLDLDLSLLVACFL